ncbi:MAG: hypothetical protein WCI03_01020, partial [bacterium]
MIKPVGIGEVGYAVGVDRTTASAVLNGRGDKLRISPATQARVLAAARQLGIARRESGAGQIAQAVGAGMSRLPIGLVITADSPIDTLTMIARLEPELSAAGYPLCVITVPTDLDGIRERILKSGVSGMLSCRTVYSSVSAFRSGMCPVIVIWAGAAKAILALLGAPPAAASPLPTAPSAAAAVSFSNPAVTTSAPTSAASTPAPVVMASARGSMSQSAPVVAPVLSLAPVPATKPEVVQASPTPAPVPFPNVTSLPTLDTAPVSEPEPVVEPDISLKRAVQSRGSATELFIPM